MKQYKHNTTKNGDELQTKGNGVRRAGRGKVKAGSGGAARQSATGTGRAARGMAAVALLPWSGRVSRLEAFRRAGGVLITSGPVIALGWRDGEKERAADKAAQRARGAAAARAAASLKRATAAGDAEAARLVGDLPAPVVAAYSAKVQAVGGGDLAARCAAELAMGKRAKLTRDERAAVAAARRARRIARAAVSSPWPFVAAVASTAPAPHEWNGLPAVTLWRGPELVAVSESGAARLVRIAQGAGKAWAASWERQGGRAIEAADVEELCAIYHGRLAAVVAEKGAAVAEVPGSLAIIFAHRGGDTMSAKALREYRRAMRAAGTLCRSFVWGKGREVCTFESREHSAYCEARERGQLETVSAGQSCFQSSPLPGELAAEKARVRSPYVRRLCALYGDALRAFWMLSGSRKWRAGLTNDLRTLATAAKVARGEGLAALGAQYLGDGERANEALRRALCDLRKHIAAGRALSASGATVGAVESVLEARRMARRGSGGDCSPLAVLKSSPLPVAGGCLTGRLWAREAAAMLSARQ